MRCFVIQPFDGGPFDRRFGEVLKPAIEKSGFDAYRVDQDPDVEIPIDDIERGIKESDVCLADITLDNPNVWYELGYANASSKQVCLICGESRVDEFPFDVRHRKIIRYATQSQSDFQRLAEEVVKRLSSMAQKIHQQASLPNSIVKADDSGLKPHEEQLLASLAQDASVSPSGTDLPSLVQDMSRAGFNRIATFAAMKTLASRALVEQRTFQDPDQYGPSHEIRLTSEGEAWIVDNLDRFELREQRNSTFQLPPEDDIPF